MVNPDGTDSKENEYLKIMRLGEVFDLTDYKICNLANDCFVFNENFFVESCLKIFRKDFIFTLHNDREEISLFDPSGSLIDKVTLSNAPSGKAWFCGENCSFEDPKESCSLEEPISKDASIPEPEEETETNEIKSVVTEKDNEKTGSNLAKIFSIKRKDDFKKAFLKIKEENLPSLEIDISGTVVVPKEVFAQNILYLSSFSQMVKVIVYSSALEKMDFKKDQKIQIKNGYLKYQNQAFVLGIGKKTRISPTKKSINHPKVRDFDLAKASKMNGSLVSLSGEILGRKGDYFFLKDKKSNEEVSVYFPKPLFMKYQGTKNGGKIFPVFYAETGKNSDFMGDFMNLKGVCDFVSGSSRIILRDLLEIEITKKDKTTPPKKSEVTPPEPPKKVSATDKSTEGTSPLQKNQEFFSPPKATLPETAKKISWETIWKLFSWKIKERVLGLF